MLNVVGNYFSYKSIKLSDSFAVYIKFSSNESDSFSEFPECTSFTIPKLEQEEDILVYGNTSQTFLIPKYDACKEMSLTFYESLFDGNSKINFLINNSSYHINQKFRSGGLSLNEGTYTDKKIDTIKIKIANNLLHKFVYAYEFKNLKIINYNLYNLDYQSDSPCQITFNFAFESFKKYVLNEDIIQNKKQKETVQQPTAKPAMVEKVEKKTYNPDGKVEVTPIDPKQIEAMWQGDLNSSDLEMIKNEQLYNPLLGELPDLEDDSDTSPDITLEQWRQESNKQELSDFNRNELVRPELIELSQMEDLDVDTKQPDITPPKTNEVKIAKQENKEKTFAGGMTAKELGVAAAKYDKINGGDMYKKIILGQLGTDAKAREEFNAAYKGINI